MCVQVCMSVYACACVCMCVRACVLECVCVCLCEKLKSKKKSKKSRKNISILEIFEILVNTFEPVCPSSATEFLEDFCMKNNNKILQK